jgi:hypothetical protein
VIPLLIKTREGWDLAENSVIYLENEVQKEKVVGEEGKEWWAEYAEKWDNISIIEFTELHYEAEQLSRLQEIQKIKTHHEACEDYVLSGTLPDIEPFKVLKLQKENTELRELLADLTETVLFGGI